MKYELDTENYDLPFDSIELSDEGVSIQIDQSVGAELVGPACGWIWRTYRNDDGWEIIAQTGFHVLPDGSVEVFDDHGAEVIRIDGRPDGVKPGELARALEEYLFPPGEDDLRSLIDIEADDGCVHIKDRGSDSPDSIRHELKEGTSGRIDLDGCSPTLIRGYRIEEVRPGLLGNSEERHTVASFLFTHTGYAVNLRIVNFSVSLEVSAASPQDVLAMYESGKLTRAAKALAAALSED